MSTIREQLLEKYPPKQGEIWKVEDIQIRMHPDNRENKISRPVLIVSSSELLKNKDFPLLNIIPLSTKGKPDKLCFPIERAFEDFAEGFKPDPNSLAILPYYQPIEKKYFKERCCKIEISTYNAIKNVLIQEVIGYEDYDLNP